jgi:hydrogenase maturation protein HypF
MAEYGLNEQVIGISFDGVGLGDDGHIWGGEFLICDLLDYDRKLWLDYIPMPGGDMATKEPWRMALSYLIKTYGDDFPDLDFLNKVPAESVSIVKQALKLKLNSPLTSSAGRLFDAAAALCGLCNYASFHAEAPMRLEGAIDPDETEAYPFKVDGPIDTSDIIRGICNDIINKIPVPVIAARFHNSVINIIFAAVDQMASESGINKVVLSGGSFQNKVILEKVEQGLAARHYDCYTPVNVPANDGGIALGQLAIAAARREQENRGRENKE